MRIKEILFEEKFRKISGNSNTGLIKLEYDYDSVTKKYSGKFSMAYINIEIAKFYSLKDNRILGIDNTGHKGVAEMHCHLRNKYLSMPKLNKIKYPVMLNVFMSLINTIERIYEKEKSK